MTNDAPKLSKRERIARLIVGPRTPLPESSIFTLEQIQEVRWNHPEYKIKRSDALLSADAILALDFVDDTE